MEEKIKVSLVGFGYMGRLHTICYRNMPLCYDNFPFNLELYRLVTSKDMDCSSTGYLKHVKEITDIYDTDILDICTPNYVHGEEIKRAVSMGIRNIYCEKPLYGVLTEEKNLTNSAEERGLHTQVAFMMRFLPAVIRAKRLIEDGVIGRVINFNCHKYHQSYIDPNRPISWRLMKDKSFGGVLMDVGIHMVDLIHYILGSIRKVAGYMDTVYNERPCGQGTAKVMTDDFAHLDIIMENGAFGTMEVSKTAAGKNEHAFFEIFGTEGSIRINTEDYDWPEIYLVKENTWTRGGFKVYDEIESDIKILWPPAKFSSGWMINSHMASQYAFILNTIGRKLSYVNPPSFKDSAAACSVIENAYASSESGGVYKDVVLCPV